MVHQKVELSNIHKRGYILNYILKHDNLISSFKKANDIFANSLKLMWPTVGSRGITEANLVHSFLSVLRNDFSAITYLEVPFGGNSRLDGLALVTNGTHGHMLLLEAKRIKENQYEKAYEQIKTDTKRMFETKRILSLLDRCESLSSVHIQQLFMADVWVGNKKRSEEVKEIWQNNNENALFYNWNKYFSVPLWESQKVKYHRMLATFNTTIFKKNEISEWQEEKNLAVHG